MRSLFTRAAVLGLPLSSLGGCILYDNNCKDDDFWSDEDSGAADDGQDDGGGELPGDGGEDPGDGGAPEPDSYWLSPDRIDQGETLIAGLQTDGALDWSHVVAVEIFGDVTPCAIQARPDELLITLSADADAMPGPVDMVLEMDDGQGIWLEDLLIVVEADGGTDGGTDSGTDGSAC